MNLKVCTISKGPLEGTNNLIKTLRMQAFGYRDQHYFFLKIWEATRKHPKNRSFISHSFRA
ncbi:MAG: transposase [Sphaerochaetaceae bacterium]